MVVDAHHHLWRYRARASAWIDARPQLAPLRRDFLGAELAAHLERNGIDRTVIVQAQDDLAETAFMCEAAREHRYIAGVVGWAPLDDPRAADAVLARYAADPAIVGVRHLIIFDPDPDWCIRPNVIDGLRLLAERGLTWDCTATIPRHLEHVATLAERIPALRQVIDHLGKPPATEGRWEPWASLVTRAAAYPNVYMKLSGLLNVATLANASRGQLQPYVDHVLASFGPQRVMIASNWPVSELGASYDDTWQQQLAMISGLSAAERAEIVGGTAIRFYRL
jgi:L-fuconolactonase